VGDLINLEFFTRQRRDDPCGVLAAARRRAEEFSAKMVEFVTGYPSRRAEYVAAHGQDWIAEGSRLQALREAFGVTRTALARALGVSPARIARLERGLPVRDARLLRAAILLFFERKGEKN